MSHAAGTRIGDYEIIDPIGKGGMGEVYRAKDLNLKRVVALKVLPAAFLRDPDRLARFQREAEVLALLNHPNIAQIYGVAESNGVRALAMELVEGESLAGPLPEETALNYARQLIEALEYAHAEGKRFLGGHECLRRIVLRPALDGSGDLEEVSRAGPWPAAGPLAGLQN